MSFRAVRRRISYKPCERYFAIAQYDGMMTGNMSFRAVGEESLTKVNIT